LTQLCLTTYPFQFTLLHVQTQQVPWFSHEFITKSEMWLDRIQSETREKLL